MISWTLRRVRVSAALGALMLLAACNSGSNGSSSSSSSSRNDASAPPECDADCARTCPDGQTACGGNCVDTKSDALNCGGCGRSCAQGAACVDGSCACKGALIRCDVDGGTAVCTDRSSDSANCGTCGNACGANESCIGGACFCPAGDLLCDGICTDPMTSPLHCGAMNSCDADGGSAGTACTSSQYCNTGSCTPCSTWTQFGRIPVSQGPTALVTADVNGDGKPDLLTAGTGNLDVLLGRGDGTFQPAQILLAVTNNGGEILVEDFDGDGHLDLATGYSNPTVFYGYGDGTFDPNGQVAQGQAAVQQLAAADVNGDGKPDIVVVDPQRPGFEVFLNMGARAFSPLAPVMTGTLNGGPWPEEVSIADVNGDGNPDLLLGDNAGYMYGSGASDIEVWLGNGDGTFTSKASYALGTNELDIVAADLTRDGKLDLVTADYNGVSVLLGKGDGTFAYDTGLVSYGEPTHVVAKDVSGDGVPDLVISGQSPGYSNDSLLEVRIGVGDGSFYPADAYAGGSAHVGVADVNADGFMDLLAGNIDTSDVIVYLGGKHHGCK